jgi:hypothetical protein
MSDAQSEAYKMNREFEDELKISNPSCKTDFLGKELNVGDKVVYMRLSYKEFIIGEITKMHDKMATIAQIHNKDNTFMCDSTKRFYHQLIKI